MIRPGITRRSGLTPARGLGYPAITMTNATADKLSRLRGAYDFAREDLRRFESAERRTADRLASAEAAITLALASPSWIADLKDDLADAGDEVAAAKGRLERARMSLAQAEAEAAAEA